MNYIKSSTILFAYSAICLGAAEKQNRIPELTATERLLYSGNYWCHALSITPECFDDSVQKLRVLGEAPNKVFKKDGLFVHPLQERNLPKTICLVERSCYAGLYKGTTDIVADIKKKLQETVSLSVMFAIKDDNDALEALNETSTRLLKNFYCTDIELVLCFKQYEYPQELIDVLYQYYAISIPIQDIITCAQYGTVWMESPPKNSKQLIAEYCAAPVILIKYPGMIVPVTCPVIKKVLEVNNKYDVWHKTDRIRFDGEVKFRNSSEYYDDSVPQIMREHGVNPNTPTDNYKPAHRKICNG